MLSSSGSTRRSGFLVLALVLTLLLTLAGCFLFIGEPEPSVGVTRDDDSPLGFRIVYALCGSEQVKSVTLVRGWSDRPQEELDIIWKISSEEGRALREVTPGTAPAGFETVVPLQEKGLPGEERLMALVETDKIDEDSVSFVVSEVPTGRVYVEDFIEEQVLSEEDFFDLGCDG